MQAETLLTEKNRDRVVTIELVGPRNDREIYELAQRWGLL